MDAPTPMARRYAGQPTPSSGGDYRDHHTHPPPPAMQPGNFWYPPPPASVPTGEPQFPPPHHLQHPPPPLASGPYTPLPPPQYPHQHQQPPVWGPPPEHLQQPYHPPSFPPAVPPPSGMNSYGMPPPNLPYPGSHPIYHPPAPLHAPHAPPPPIPPAAPPHGYSQPSQTWENPSWNATHGWNYTDSKFSYNEEDWAARARAWAAGSSTSDSLPVQPHYMPSGTPSNLYHEHYLRGSGDAFTDGQHSSFSTQDQHLSDSATDPNRRVNNLQESSLDSMSYSVTNFPAYDARNEDLATDAGVKVPLPQEMFSSATSINVQEVSSSYSSFSDNKVAADQLENSSVTPHLPSPVMSVTGSLATLDVSPISREQTHLPISDQLVEFSDHSDRSQVIEHIPFGQVQTQNAVSANADQGRPIDQNLPSSSVHTWAQSITGGPLFPHPTSVPAVTQFDSSIPSSLPGHPTQGFGRIQGPSFHHGISSFGAPFGFDTGSSLHPAAAFAVDANDAFNLSERPKKAAVPNWLRDEIIKKKSKISSTMHEHVDGGSSHSSVAELHDKVSRRGEIADSKTIDSTKSTEDEDDEEDDVDAARSAAINQEIKRVLTDVLLKVTDELFEEIATKVVNEDELEVDNIYVATKCKDSSPPPQSVTPKTSTTIAVPASSMPAKIGAISHSLLGSSGGDLLGLASYASDDDSEETQNSSLALTGKVSDSSNQHENQNGTTDDSVKQQEVSFQETSEEPSNSLIHDETDKKNSCSINGMLSKKSGLEFVRPGGADKSLESGSSLDKKVLIRERMDPESLSAFGDSANGKSKRNNVLESTGKLSSSSVPCARKGSSDRNFVEEAESLVTKSRTEDLVAENLMKSADKVRKPEKTDNWAISKSKSKNHNSKQTTDMRMLDSKRVAYHDNYVVDSNSLLREKKDRVKENDHWKHEHVRDGKDRFKEAAKDSYRQNRANRQTSSPSNRSRNGKESSLGNSSDGSEEISETLKRRRLQASRHSLSPSPTRSRRQVLRSPHSKHTQRRHSPYSHADTRRRRSRSKSPAHRKRSEKHER